MDMDSQKEGVGMTAQTSRILSTVAQELHVSEEDVLRQGLRTYLERQLRAIKTEIFAISGSYGINSAEEMESRYRDGSLDEADSWRDLQHLDHLEYKRDRLVQLIEAVS
jgi:hypothetical protein